MHTKKELVSRKTRLRNSARRHQERTKRGNVTKIGVYIYREGKQWHHG